MPTRDEFFDNLWKAAQHESQEKEATQQQQADKRFEATHKAVEQIATVLPKVVEQQNLIAGRLEQLETMNKQVRQEQTNDPYKNLDEATGLTRNVVAPVIQHEVTQTVDRAVKQAFEQNFGPALRESQAIEEYQKAHPDFDISKFNQYINKNPEVKQLVRQAANGGAYAAGIEYGEIRRVLDDKISQEARAQAKGEQRRGMIQASRGDAAILGGTGANGTTRNPQQRALSADQVTSIFQKAEAGDWKDFENAYVKANIPDEEYFQRLAQS